MAAGQVEWAKRRLEAEAGELGEQVAGLRTGQEGQVAARRQLEEEATGLRGDLEEAGGGRRLAEECWREAAAEAGCLGEEGWARRKVEAEARQAGWWWRRRRLPWRG